jgi:hypothetical protein
MRDVQETINAADQCHARSLVLLMSSEDHNGPIAAAVLKYGFRNQLKVVPVAIEAGPPTQKDLESIFHLRGDSRRPPILLVSPDGKLAGMAAAAYRLKSMKMPLQDVLRLAEVPGASEQTNKTIRDFATQYAATMQSPTTAPASRPAPSSQEAPSTEVQPAGPTVR